MAGSGANKRTWQEIDDWLGRRPEKKAAVLRSG
jgi:hypothetical protein